MIIAVRFLSFFLMIYWMQLAHSFTVLIDPGHGGKFTGACGACGRVIEKQATLDIALRLAQTLKRQGIDSRLTRIHDVALSSNLIDDLNQRARLADGCDALISLHLDYSFIPTTQCFQLYIPYREVISTKDYLLAGFLHACLAHFFEPVWCGGSMNNLNKVDGGIRQAKFNVLMKSKCPAAVLIELGYLSHAPTERKLAAPLHRQQLAEVLGKGILDYFETLKDAVKHQKKSEQIKMLT